MGLGPRGQYINKWYTFSASLLVQLFFGSAYTFPLFASLLKSTFDLTQGQLEFVASGANVLGSCAILSGLTYDALERHKRLGPRLVLLAGIGFNLSGCLGLWIAVTGRFQARLGHLAVLAALAANGGMWADTTSLVTNVRNFPASRGSVLAALKACVSLSGPLFACFFSGLFLSDHAAAFLLFLALAPAAVALLALPFVNHCSFLQESELREGHALSAERRFSLALLSLGVLSLYLVSITTLEALQPWSRAARLGATAGAAALLLPLALLPWGSGGLLSRRVRLHQRLGLYTDEGAEHEEAAGAGERQEAGQGAQAGSGEAAGGARDGSGSAGGSGGDGGTLHQPLLEPSEGAESGAELAAKQALPELSPWQCLASPDFWLLSTACAIGTGTGLTLLNNLAQLVAALSSQSRAIPVLVSFFGVSNCAGRLLLGHIPERLLHTRGTPRLLFLPLVSALMSAASLALAAANLGLLAPAVALVGFAYGGHWALLPTLVSELFGLRRFAANLALVMMAPSVGSVALSMALTIWFYRRALERHGGGGHTCVGQDCFRPTFLVLSALGLAAVACGAVLHRRQRGLYRREHRQVALFDEETRAAHQ
ncbi:hypothetical protein ABPG75_010831 [Micractinium tetrahymenae]